MSPNKSGSINWRKMKPIAILLTILAIAGLTPRFTLAKADFLPPEIRDVELGMTSSQVIDRIKNSGQHSITPIAKGTRTKLIWPLANNMYYKCVEFEFTEKNRLYLMRFVLNNELRWNLTSLKKQFFDRYHISWEDPGRFRARNNDVMVYVPSEGKDIFFELRDITTGQNSFEIFSRNISAQDRQHVKAKVSASKEVGTTAAPAKGNVSNSNEKKTPVPQGK